MAITAVVAAVLRPRLFPRLRSHPHLLPVAVGQVDVRQLVMVNVEDRASLDARPVPWDQRASTRTLVSLSLLQFLLRTPMLTRPPNDRLLPMPVNSRYRFKTASRCPLSILAWF